MAERFIAFRYAKDRKVRMRWIYAKALEDGLFDTSQGREILARLQEADHIIDIKQVEMTWEELRDAQDAEMCHGDTLGGTE